MKDKVQKIREEIEKLHKEYRNKKGALYYRKALRAVLYLIDTLQKEPVDYEKLNTMLDDALSKETKESLNERFNKEEPVSNDFEMALAEMIDKAQTSVVEPWVVAAQWKDELIKLAKSEEPVSEQKLSNVQRIGKNWKEELFEKNRLKHCNSITNEQAELEQEFIDKHLDKHQRMPTFLDAIEYGMRLQKEKKKKAMDLGEPPYLISVEQAYYRTLKLLED